MYGKTLIGSVERPVGGWSEQLINNANRNKSTVVEKLGEYQNFVARGNPLPISSTANRGT